MSPVDRQVPQGDEVFLDHVGWFIRDVAEASAAFERLGFVLTPFVVSRNADPAGGKPKPSGTGNRCAMLRRGYLELIAAIDGVDTPLARQHRAAVAQRVGIHVIAFTVADASRAHQRLKSEGFEPGEPVLLRRPIRAPDGTDAFAAFTVIRVPPEKMLEGRIQVLTQETPDLIWQPQLIARDNGIAGLGGVLLCVNDPAEAAARFGRFLGRKPKGAQDYSVLDLDRGRLGFGTPGRCGALVPGAGLPGPPSIAALALVADDPRATERRIPAESAAGTTIVIHRAGEAWPPNP